jgi:AraC family transcriptional regulator
VRDEAVRHRRRELVAVSSTIHWPGMRSEYAWIPPQDNPTTTKPHQIGVSFTRHTNLVRESAGRAVRSDVAAGAVFVTGDDAITWIDVADTTEALEIYPDPELVRRVAGDVPRIEAALGVRDAVVFGLASVLKRAHVTGGALTDVEASTVAHRLVAHMLGVYREGGAVATRPPVGALDRRVVNRVAEYVDAQLAGPITLDGMAAVAALSPFHFARAFKATIGMTPHRFVTARRLEAAKTALLTTDISVVRIAHDVGFSNVSHFRRVFRRELGVPPGELRR